MIIDFIIELYHDYKYPIGFYFLLLILLGMILELIILLMKG